MKNQYFGDVGDYGKYGLLRYLAKNEIRIAVNWYLTQNIDGSNDGKHTRYLTAEKEAEYSKYDPELYALLQGLLLPKPTVRDVIEFEQKNAIPDAIYYHEYLKMQDYSAAAEKRTHRIEWHEKALESCQGADLIFLDPDNGLAEKEPKPLKRAEKYVYADEIVNYYECGQDVVYYCHKGRRKDGAWEKYLLTMKKQLPEAELMAITFHRGTQRSYVFICHPKHAERYRQLLTAFILEWSGLFTPEGGLKRVLKG